MPGYRYAWAVQAKVREGTEQLNVLENSGLSEIRWFYLAEDCPLPSNVRADAPFGHLHLSWDGSMQNETYIVEYRMKAPVGEPVNYWMKEETAEPDIVLRRNTQEGDVVEYRIGAKCQTGTPFYGVQIGEFTIPRSDTIVDTNCGKEPERDTNVSTEPLPILKVGDILTAGGGASVYVMEVSGSNGVFSGKGYTIMPKMFGYAKLRVHWTNIKVNIDYIVTDGVIDGDYDGEKSISLDKPANTAQANGGLTYVNKKVDFAVPDGSEFVFDPNANLITISNSGNAIGTIDMSLLTTSNGDMANDGKSIFPITITDTNGNVYQVETPPMDNSAQTSDTTSQNNTPITLIATKISQEDELLQQANKPYYMVGNHKFYHGETIYLPWSTQTKYKFQAFRDSVNKFNEGTKWSGIAQLDSAQAYFEPNQVSNDINGTLISCIYDNGEQHDTLQCRIVVVNVEFEEDPNQKWGFDENNPSKEDLYPSYCKGIPWKSLNKGSTKDVVKVIVHPAGAENKVTLFTSNPSITVGNIVSSNGSVTLSSSDNGYIGVKVGKFVNDSMRLNIAAYELMEVNVKIVNIDEENDDVQAVNFGGSTVSSTTPVVLWGNNRFLDTKPVGDDYVLYRATERDSVIVAGPNKICDTRANNTNIVSTDLSKNNFETTINNIYKQAVVKVNIEYDATHEVVNYDLNKDSMIDSRTDSGELEKIYEFITRTEGDKKCLCLVDYPSSNNSNGQFRFQDNAGVFYYRKMNSKTTSDIYKTAAHELGHGVFKLDHPFHDDRMPSYPKRLTTGSRWVDKDINTIMEWDGGWPRDKVRKYQWDDLRNENGNPNKYKHTKKNKS
ncbi:hypothetical protein FACS1894201_09660 [Bacteroidia bacterium]|nr:hypothetical protein FACS1894201_09660 [Bacteroidia bacterium]